MNDNTVCYKKKLCSFFFDQASLKPAFAVTGASQGIENLGIESKGILQALS